MNSVPAAAVIRGGQALFRITGRKEHVGRLQSSSESRLFLLLKWNLTDVSQLIHSPLGLYKPCKIPEILSGGAPEITDID